MQFECSLKKISRKPQGLRDISISSKQSRLGVDVCVFGVFLDKLAAWRNVVAREH